MPDQPNADAPDPSSAAPTSAPSWAERHPVAAALEPLGGGVGLALALDPLAVADLDDITLVEALAGWERVASWAAARQAEVIAEMRRRNCGDAHEFVIDEVGARLSLSRRAAQHVVRRADGLADLPEVHDALSSGAIDIRRADALVRETDHLSASDARTLATTVLPDAPGLTAPQLRAAVRRAEVVRDPSAAADRHTRVRAERCVRVTPAPDAMAWVTAFLPAVDAMTVVTALDALAAACSPEDGRPLDARRADALTDVLRDVLDSGVGPYGRVPTEQRRRPHLQLTVNAASTVPAGEGVAELAGYGPVPASVAREVAAEAAWRVTGIDPRTGEAAARSSRSYRPGAEVAGLVLARDVTCTFLGCRVPAQRCDIDHVEPFDPERPAEAQTVETNLATLCRHHHRLKTHGSWSSSRDPATGVTAWHSPTGHSYTRAPIPADPEWDQPRRRPPRPETDPDEGLPDATDRILDLWRRAAAPRSRDDQPTGDRSGRDHTSG